METISKVDAGYSAAEQAKVSAPKPIERTHISGTEMAAIRPTATHTKHADRGGAGQHGGEQQHKEHNPSEATINDAVSKANMKMEHTRCEYSYHKETNRVSIKVINADTEEVVREIPPEKSLDMLQKMWELAGMLVDEKR